MSLALYHGANSVCSIKVRLVLAEKGLEWESRHIDLPKGEQFSPAFLAINPAAIVPVLDHGGRLIFESSVISEYLDGLSAETRLMPEDPYQQAKTRTWGVLTLGYHDAVNTLTFASYQRAMLRAKPPEELAARWEAMPDKIKARKLQDLVAHGAASDYVPVAFAQMQRMCQMIEADLAKGPWLMGARYSLADALLTAYVYRVACIGLEGLWESRFPRMTDWWARICARPSLNEASAGWITEAMVDKIRTAGREAYCADDSFAEYLT